MIKHSGLHAARGQIGWILALIVSTAVVVKLEQLELGAQFATLTVNPLAEPALPLDHDLARARLLAPDPATAAPMDQARLLIALSLAGTQDAADFDALAAEAAQTVADVEATVPSDPVLLNAIALCRSVFAL
ncbi:hypothetical protein [Yoonia sp.]|uniref:hypothetical protein n=1 Tax=Yoonia sp. TaxID=2212373 RepID=UPI00391D47E7